MPRKKSKALRTSAGLKIPAGAKKYMSYDDDGNELWDIEDVIEQRVRDGKNEYLVKWTNWPYRYCTWEPEESFLEDMSIIMKFVEEKNEGVKRIFKRSIAKQEKPTKQLSTKKKAIRRSGRGRRPKEPELSPDTKIIIERVIGGNALKTSDVFICKNIEEKGIFSQNKEEEKKIEKNKRNSTENRRGRFQSFKNFIDENDSMESVEDDNDNLSMAGSEKSGLSVPLMENDLEKISEYRVVIEECFAFSKSNLNQAGSFKFKVAFYDDANNLKGYDYFSYDEIKQKKWENELMRFYTQELLTEMIENGASITQNIKVI